MSIMYALEPLRVEEPVLAESVFDRRESNVRAMCRSFGEMLIRASKAEIVAESGRRYVDFTSGQGALNYGYNHPAMKEALVAYLARDGIPHALDLFTDAKQSFMEAFEGTILLPRGLDHRMHFTGPTGANAVEAAIKLARKVTGRSNVVAFTGGYHGMSLGALAATATKAARRVSGVPLNNVIRVPYDGFYTDGRDTVADFRAMLLNSAGGLESPAAFVVEVIQGKGGMRVAGTPWLLRLQALAREVGALLIVDEIFAGCGRTGSFFSFEEIGLIPDVICLSKSLSGFGLPMSMNLVRPAVDDAWDPGDHAGTFRGNGHAFVTAKAAIDLWADPGFLSRTQALRCNFEARLKGTMRVSRDASFCLVGRGLMRGLAFAEPERAALVAALAREMGLFTTTCGPNDEVVKLLPPLVIGNSQLFDMLDVLDSALQRTA